MVNELTTSREESGARSDYPEARTDGAARGEPNVFELSRVVTEVDKMSRKKTIVNSQKDTAERPIARPVWTARSWLPACAQPIKAKLESFMVDDMKYCGLLNETDLTQVQQRIIASGTLTVDEINTFFLKKN